MEFRRAFVRLWNTCTSQLPSVFNGFITIIAFTDTGRMRRFRFKKGLLILGALIMTLFFLSSVSSFIELVRGQYHRARLASLEAENRSLASLLEGQVEQLSRLKLEIARLREFERNLRAVSGLSSPREPIAPAGQGGG